MVRFARSGGEANAISVRIGRAASGRDGVAFCGYHGWHDWYLSANIEDSDNLSEHLLGGLSTNGVPKNLAGSAFPFRYGDFAKLENLVKEKDIGVIKMEVVRNKIPDLKFLRNVRNLATKNNIVLIFDECTSGFRETFGGYHKLLGVNPDIATFGKALGNGYAITAILGSRAVMEVAQSTFISSTFWTERIGPTAALATLFEMEKLDSWNIISGKGKAIKKGWLDLGKANQLEIVVSGIDAIPSFVIPSENWQYFKTFISQELLKDGILASNLMYLCTMHEEKHFDRYFEALDKVFNTISSNFATDNPEALLDGLVSHKGFERLN